MAYTNSPLVNVTMLSPNHSGLRTEPITKITIHHMAGNLTVEGCGSVFAPASRQASSNYGIGSDGRIGLYVEEKNRSWATSSAWNDNRAVTIEVANSYCGGDWPVSDKALASLIKLCTDICQRNGIKKLEYTGDASGNLTMHKWFAATGCPGPYLSSKFPYIAAEVNKRLGAATPTKPAKPAKPADTTKTLYRVQLGAFSKQDNAKALLAKVKAKGFKDAFVAGPENKLYKVQVGAYSVKANAENQLSAIKKAGFTDAFIASTAATTPKKKSVTEVAKEVIAGKWGAGDARKTALTKAGYDYNAVQSEVNKLMK